MGVVETARKRTDNRYWNRKAGSMTSAPRTELNAVRWQVKSPESSRSVCSPDPKHELLHELLCLREKELADTSEAHRGDEAEGRAFRLCRSQSPPSVPPVTGPNCRTGASDETLRPNASDQGGPCAR